MYVCIYVCMYVCYAYLGVANGACEETLCSHCDERPVLSVAHPVHRASDTEVQRYRRANPPLPPPYLSLTLPPSQDYLTFLGVTLCRLVSSRADQSNIII